MNWRTQTVLTNIQKLVKWFCPELGNLGVGLAPLASQNQQDPGKPKFDSQDSHHVFLRLIQTTLHLCACCAYRVQKTKTTLEDSTKMMMMHKNDDDDGTKMMMTQK